MAEAAKDTSVLLLVMPWASLGSGAIGVGLLKQILTASGKQMTKPVAAKDRLNPDSINVLLRYVQSHWFKRPTMLP